MHTDTHSQATAQSYKQAQITTKQHTNTCMYTHKHDRNSPFHTNNFPLTHSASANLVAKKKNTSPCSVADSECIKASNSLKMRKFSWGYWISPSSLCSVVSLTYRAQYWMDQTRHKGTTRRQVSFEVEFSLLYSEYYCWFICSSGRRTKVLSLQHERDGGWYYMFGA